MLVAIALAELDGSGQKAILTASADGWVVALNHQCQKIWSQHLAAVPVTLKTLNTGAETRIIIACENGAIYVLNRQGDTVATAQVSGKPVCMETCRQKMVVATENGGLEIVPID